MEKGFFQILPQFWLMIYKTVDKKWATNFEYSNDQIMILKPHYLKLDVANSGFVDSHQTSLGVVLMLRMLDLVSLAPLASWEW